MAGRVAPKFDPQSATQAFLERHAAECVELGCATADTNLEIALQMIGLPLAVVIAALALHWLGFWRASYERLSRRFERPVFGAALFGALVMAVFVAVRMPFAFYHEVILQRTNGVTIVTLDDPRFAPPTFVDRVLSFLWDQAELVLMLGLAAAVVAPLALFVLGRAPRTAILAAALGAFVWLVTPDRPPWEETYAIPSGPLHDDVAEIAARAGIPMERVRVGYKREFTSSLEEARAEWHDGGTKAIMNEAMINILRTHPRTYSPRYELFTAAEFRAVAAHEIAHIKHRHWEWLILAMAALVGIFTALAASLAVRISSRRVPLIQTDRATRGVFLAMFFAFGFGLWHVMQPAVINVIRVTEKQADQTALELSGEPDGAAALAFRIARGRPMERNHWYNHLYTTHPDSRTRIERAMRWKAQNTPTQYRASGPSGALRTRFVDRTEPVEDWPPTK